MNAQSRLAHAVKKAKTSLVLEHLFTKIQLGLLVALSVSFILMIVSRFFVFPYYSQIALIASIMIFVSWVLYILWTKPSKEHSIYALDGYFPHNQLRTVFSIDDTSTPLYQHLLKQTDDHAEIALLKFKAREKKIVHVPYILGSFFIAVAIFALTLFPATTQLAAKDAEQENKIITDMKKEVKKLEKKAKSKEVKKELAKLQEKLKETKTSEEALREFVKKQKELQLKEQQLLEKKELAKSDEKGEVKGLSKAEVKELADLQKANDLLMNKAKDAQTAMSQQGKPLSQSLQSALQNQQANGQNQNQSATSNSNASQSSNQNGSSSQNNSTSQSNTQSSPNQNGKNQSQGQGQGQGQSQGQGQGQGNGSGTGQGAGLGQGNRNLLAIPERIGSKGETSVDSGKMGEGSAAEIHETENGPVHKGSIRPYEEVVGSYKDSYFQTTDRLQLPKELQNIVQNYFSTIENK
ncbi:hypothetical protein ACQKND_02625 [Viridibacillus arvi]|uniref:hypothetical protein n=1 Tax=Viridibacillus arvi TaxID=263475 RepID=UPI003CFF253A